MDLSTLQQQGTRRLLMDRLYKLYNCYKLQHCTVGLRAVLYLPYRGIQSYSHPYRVQLPRSTAGGVDHE